MLKACNKNVFGIILCFHYTGVIHFESIDDVYVDHGNKKMAAFCVKTLDRIYHLSSTSPEAMRVWVDVIFSGAHGYNRFLGQDWRLCISVDEQQRQRQLLEPNWQAASLLFDLEHPIMSLVPSRSAQIFNNNNYL